MIAEAIENSLKTLNISSDEFSELIIRLLDYGVITRDKSQVEAKLYDRFIQCFELVEDYLSVLHVRIQHDPKFCFIRVFPPNAIVPGMVEVDNSAFNSGFRVKPSQMDIAAILVLRVEYEKSLREGQVDEKGAVLIPLESLAISHQNLLKRPLPESHAERLSIFKRLRQLRLIDFNIDDDFSSQDSWISIQPSITSFVSDEVLSALYPATADVKNTIKNSIQSSRKSAKSNQPLDKPNHRPDSNSKQKINKNRKKSARKTTEITTKQPEQSDVL